MVGELNKSFGFLWKSILSSFPPHPSSLKPKPSAVAFRRNKNPQTHPEASLLVPTESGRGGFESLLEHDSIAFCHWGPSVPKKIDKPGYVRYNTFFHVPKNNEGESNLTLITWFPHRRPLYCWMPLIKNFFSVTGLVIWSYQN